MDRLWIGALIWLALVLFLALLTGRYLRRSDQREPYSQDAFPDAAAGSVDERSAIAPRIEPVPPSLPRRGQPDAPAGDGAQHHYTGGPPRGSYRATAPGDGARNDGLERPPPAASPERPTQLQPGDKRPDSTGSAPRTPALPPSRSPFHRHL